MREEFAEVLGPRRCISQESGRTFHLKKRTEYCTSSRITFTFVSVLRLKKNSYRAFSNCERS